MRLNALNFAINRMFASSSGSAVPSLISRLFTPGTAGFCGGMSVTEAFDAGLMFQDSAGTTPAALEMPVGLVLGQVGSINASQTTTTKRPTLKDDGSGHLYLDFDGTDDCFVTPSIDLTGTDKVTVFAGVRTNTDALGMLVEFSENIGLTNNNFYLASGTDIVTGYNFNTKMPYAFSAACAATYTIAAPNSSVVAVTSDIAGSSNTMAVNGVAGTPNSASLGTGNFGNYPAFIGARNDGSKFQFNGRMYTLPIVVGRAVEPALIEEVEDAINASMGGIY